MSSTDNKEQVIYLLQEALEAIKKSDYATIRNVKIAAEIKDAPRFSWEEKNWKEFMSGGVDVSFEVSYHMPPKE